jgi:hypothetical protein
VILHMRHSLIESIGEQYLRTVLTYVRVSILVYIKLNYFECLLLMLIDSNI